MTCRKANGNALNHLHSGVVDIPAKDDSVQSKFMTQRCLLLTCEQSSVGSHGKKNSNDQQP